MKSVWLFVAGVCGGALAVFYWLPADHQPDAGMPAGEAAIRPDLVVPDYERGREADVSNAASSALSAIAALAREAPAAALQSALLLEPAALRQAAVQRLAAAWARLDPREALASAAELPADLRGAFESSLTREWAFVDPDGFFSHAESARSIDSLLAGLELLIASDPARVFRIAAQAGPAGNAEINALYLRAVRGMADRDPLATIASLQTLAAGAQRDPILNSIAEAYAARNADAALVWARSLAPPSAAVVSTVIESLASRDPIRAYELTQEIAGGVITVDTLAGTLARGALRGAQSPAALASLLIGRGEAGAESMLNQLMSQWMRIDPDSAIRWVTTNSEAVTSDMTQAMVANLAFEDVRLAAQIGDQIPSAFQDQWLTSVAFRYGQFDVQEAINWLPQYSNHPAYSKLLDETLRGAAITSPQFAADFIASGLAQPSAATIAGIARALTDQDPEAAVRWAGRLADPGNSATALETTISYWVQRDGAAAQRFVLAQARGSARDRALQSLMQSGAIVASIDPVLLVDAFQSEEQAQQAVIQYITMATRVPAQFRATALPRAEQLLERVADPVARETAAAAIAAVR